MDQIKNLKSSEIKVCEQYMLEAEKYEQKYGYESVVFMQVGDFYEMYGAVLENKDEVYYQKLLDVCQKCSIIYSPKASVKFIKKHDNTLYMAGFPLHALDKFLNLMVDTYEWYVIVINQVKKYIGGKQEVSRKVFGVYSPGTNYNINKDSNTLVCIYMELQKSRFNKFGKILYSGLSHLDCITGDSSIKEIWNHYDTINMTIDEIRKFICVHNPKEVILYHQGMDDLIKNSDILDSISVKNRCHHVFNHLPDKCYTKPSYQESLFQDIFKPQTQLNIFQYLGLDRKPFATISYVLLLNYIWNGLPNIVEQLAKPTVLDNQLYLTLANDSLEQLKVVHESGFFKRHHLSLLTLLDNTITAIGHRAFRFRLLNPIRNIEILEKRYMQIEFMMDKNKKGIARTELTNAIKQKLIHILDLERMNRRMGMLALTPLEFTTLDRTCQSVYDLIKFIQNFSKTKHIIKNILPTPSQLLKFKRFIKDYKSKLNLEECQQYNNIHDITRNIFKLGVHPDIDKVQEEYDNDNKILTEIKDTLTHMIKTHKIYQDKARKGNGCKVENIIRQEYNEKYKHYLCCSPANAKILSKALSDVTSKYCIKIGEYKIKAKDIEFDKINGTRVRLKIDCITTSSVTMISTGYVIRSMVKHRYLEYLSQLYKEHSIVFKNIIDFIGEIDIIRSCTVTAINNNYHQPHINTDHSNSYIETQKIRHPLIEKINPNIPYVPHDIIIGKDNQNGILLFGANASGKSACMKSLGLNLIMAQAGMYVAAKKFMYHPYNYLFTRIQGNDDIQRGKSSFEVEMSELKTILDNVDNHSIILGDELCRGTENISGTAIVSAGIIKLAKVNSSFIFATHLHGLDDIDEVTQLENVKFKHLTVQYNAEQNKLIYDRKMKDGVGATIYGLEVCKALSLDNEFLDMANTIRKRIINQSDNIKSIKASNYNSNVYQDKCAICNKNKDHIHHIKFQSLADSNNMISDIDSHKNIAHNQVALCEECHHRVHNGEIDIKGYISTSHGRELDFEIST
jgi:DNA mismatch repair protein MutS